MLLTLSTYRTTQLEGLVYFGLWLHRLSILVRLVCKAIIRLILVTAKIGNNQT